MPLLNIIGIIRLSLRQAEDRRIKNAVLCLKYISLHAVTLTFIILCVKTEGVLKSIPAVCAVASALCSVLYRGILIREMFLISESFLMTGSNDRITVPSNIILISGELVFLSAVWSVFAFMLSPSFLCFRFGLSYYSLSSDKNGFMLLLAASMLLAAGGMIFASVTAERLSCAEYLWVSGKCSCMTSALNCSWELTRDNGSDALRLALLSFFFGLPISALCKMNLSRKLIRKKGLPSSEGLFLEFSRDQYGELHLEIV